jgi:hypothetical protein
MGISAGYGKSGRSDCSALWGLGREELTICFKLTEKYL